jgi:hypothetical protein
MTTLTEKETKLVDYLLANTDGSDGHICSEKFMDLKELDWSMETLKGVFGSLVNKKILTYGDFIPDHNEVRGGGMDQQKLVQCPPSYLFNFTMLCHFLFCRMGRERGGGCR